MKDKILYLILGILIGAVITAGCFLVLGKSKSKGMPEFKGDKEMMEKFENFDPENFDPENMPEMPNGERRERPDKDKKANSETVSEENTENTENTGSSSNSSRGGFSFDGMPGGGSGMPGGSSGRP